MNKQSSIIPRPTTKRQHSSPANCGVARINLSEAVAKITNSGPRSCTNPFLNSIHSISEDRNSNESKNQYCDNKVDEKFTVESSGGGQYVVYERMLQKNPFIHQRNDEMSIFSFPSNGNIGDELTDEYEKNQLNNQSSSGSAVNNSNKSTHTLIQLNDDTCKTEFGNDLVDIKYDDINQICQNSRIHSLSDTEDSDNVRKSASSSVDYKVDGTSKNPFIAGNLHKTMSDTFLEQYSSNNSKSNTVKNQTWSPSRSLTISQKPVPNTSNESMSMRQLSNLQMSINLSENDLKRATSCDSVNSESSVVLADLVQQAIPTVTGQLCVGLQYDKLVLFLTTYQFS